jgi:hypothetical protein
MPSNPAPDLRSPGLHRYHGIEGISARVQTIKGIVPNTVMPLSGNIITKSERTSGTAAFSKIFSHRY